jgi:hypothetical protein
VAVFLFLAIFEFFLEMALATVGELFCFVSFVVLVIP